MNTTYDQLCGAIGLLEQNDIEVPAIIKERLRIIATDGITDSTELEVLHRVYREKCLSLKLIEPGYLFNLNDCC
jgi:hypothetical protein